MMNFNFLNAAIESTNGNEFKVLYLICNTLSLNNSNRIRIYREILAEKCNLTEKQITRITNELERKNLIKKDIVSNGITTKNFYSLNLNILKDKNVPLNNIKGDKNVPLTNGRNIDNESFFNNKQNMDKNVQINPSNLDKNVPLNNKEYKKIILNKKNNINNNILNIIENINKENETIVEKQNSDTNTIENLDEKNNEIRNNCDTNTSENSNTLNHNDNSINEIPMNKEQVKREIEYFNTFEKILYQVKNLEQVQDLRNKIYEWLLRVTENNTKLLKSEYLNALKNLGAKIAEKEKEFESNNTNASESNNTNENVSSNTNENVSSNTNTKKFAFKCSVSASNAENEQIPSNDNLKPTEDKEKANNVQAIQTIAKVTNTKENQLQIKLNESQKAGNNPRNSYAVQCGELQSNDNFSSTEGKEKALNGKSETVTDAVNMIETYEERINKVESVESVESLYTNCKNYFKKWSERYLESLTTDEIDFVKNKYKKMVNSKNDRLATLKFIMSVKLSK